MIGFVIPLRPSSTSSDWSKTLDLLRRSLASVLASEDGDLRVFVASHDLDRLDGVDDPRVEWIRVDFAAPPEDDPKRQQRDRNWKVAHGTLAAAERGADWIFVLDADDLVSRHLTSAIHGARDYDAATLDHGYEIHAGRRRAYLRHDLSHISGSTFAIRTQHMFEDGERTFWKCIALTQNHKTFDSYLRGRGLRVIKLEAPFAAYVRFHGQNMSDVQRTDSLSSRLRQWLKFGIFGKPFDGALAEEFSFVPSGK